MHVSKHGTKCVLSKSTLPDYCPLSCEICQTLPRRTYIGKCPVATAALKTITPANVNPGSQYSMRLPQVQCGINKM